MATVTAGKTTMIHVETADNGIYNRDGDEPARYIAWDIQAETEDGDTAVNGRFAVFEPSDGSVGRYAAEWSTPLQEDRFYGLARSLGEHRDGFGGLMDPQDVSVHLYDSYPAEQPTVTAGWREYNESYLDYNGNEAVEFVDVGAIGQLLVGWDENGNEERIHPQNVRVILPQDRVDSVDHAVKRTTAYMDVTRPLLGTAEPDILDDIETELHQEVVERVEL
ncbi:MAG: hypothetical protein ABEI97_02700 [Candidatus Nanohaloarchaea archaeon]